MNNTIYSATTGMLAHQKAMDISSKNLANGEINGYKSTDVKMTSFGEYMTYKIDGSGKTEIGSTTRGVLADDFYNDFGQGTIYSTNKPLDFAVNGDGFFTLTNPDGTSVITRDGNFAVDDNGFLISDTNGFVMGQNGKINIGGYSEITVSENGEISGDGNVIDTLLITVPQDTAGIKMLQTGEFLNPNGVSSVFTGKIIQGALERSNINYINEMASMIEDSRAFQSCSQIVKMADQLMQKTVNEIGRV